MVRRLLLVIIPSLFLIASTPLPDQAIALLVLPGVGSCTAFYVEPAYELRENASIVASAGHCAQMGPAFVNGEEIEWLVAVRDGSGADFAIGFVQDNRPSKTYHGFAAQRASPGDRVFIEGFPYGERLSAWGVVVPLEDIFSDDIPVAMRVNLESPLGPGASGSPIMNAQGEVVGILWGTNRWDHLQIVGTPITR